ncbi:short-chain dehydrogenase [Novosphingobium malaysiense]|uniref:Short-chain dehydrogenase n=2 Tax=Novosphingobium malaysiense TaxID=1348853 RepID=A0A0B1ZIK8_9SPHN|nr:short-chain dehydrogenase [Novosphingobium malaysiense]
MNRRFEGKIAIVTGGASGIGAACIERLNGEGAKVVCCDLQTPQRVVPDVEFLSCNVADEVAVAALVAKVVEEHGRIDVLVNNAGTAGREQVRIHELSFATWDLVQSVNARGTFAMMRAVIPHMLAAGGGNIVNVASIGSFRATPMAASYLASKGAMMMLTRAGAVEYAKDNIRINAVCPSTTETAILEHTSPEALERLVARHPQGRLGRPEEVAALVAFLASGEAPHITGGAYLIDGGRSAA